MTAATRTHTAPPVPFEPQAVLKRLHLEAHRGPEYVRRQAGRILTRIFGPAWRDWPDRPPRGPDAALSPDQRAWFHLHPALPLPADGTDAADPTQEDSLEDDDDPW